jgi:peptide/nickel transport system ATP-binding protein
MLKAEGITKRFRSPGGWVAALDGVSLALSPGERLGLLGPSGSGKSTLARILPLLLKPDSGAVELDGMDIRTWGIKVPREIRRAVQLIWQSPRLASDPRLRIKEMILEPLAANGMLPNSSSKRQATLDMWSERVGLTRELLSRHPHAVSDGQLQRACLARALLLQPRYLICDELTSSLDVSTQAALLKVISEEQNQRELGVLLITHDRILANHWCTGIVEIRNGKLLRRGLTS